MIESTVVPDRSKEMHVEDEFFGKWFPRIGALALVLGAGFGFKYAIDQGWVGPRLRVMVGLLLASILIGVGDWTRKREWTAYAQAITGGGVALLYLTLWASVEMYGLLPPSIAFVCLAGVSGLGCVLALRHESQALALLSVIGGFSNPFVTGASADMPQGLYLYTLCIDLAVVVLSFMRPWRLLEKVAFAGSWIVFEVGTGTPTVSLLAATGIFLMFAAVPYARVLLRREQGLTDFAFVPVNSLIYYFAVFVRLDGDLEWARGPFTLVLAGLFLAGFVALRDREEDDSAIGRSSAVMSLLFLTLWPPVELGAELMALGWAIEALLLGVVALKVKDEFLRWGAWIVLSMSAGTHLVFVTVDPVGSVASDYGRFVFVALIAALYVGAHIAHRELATDLRDLGVLAANVLSILWISLEVLSVVSDGGAVVPRSEDLQFGLSGAWALYASGALVVGIVCRLRAARLMSLALFGVTLGKMAIHDLWLLDTLQRLVGFMGIGVLLLTCSLMYHRFRNLLLPDTETAGWRAP
jgi:uncharacterized membrane protein